MLTKSLLLTQAKVAAQRQFLLNPAALIVSAPVRGYMPYYQKKNDKYFKPQYFDNVQRTPQGGAKTKFNTQDPLFFDYRHEHINGGIQMYIDNIKDKGTYRMPLRNTGFLLYHLAKNDIYDPDLFANFEAVYREISSTSMTARHAMGGVYGYYRSNQGTKFGVDFWEEHLQKVSAHLHVQDIAELAEGFSLNRTLPREHFRQKLTEVHKPVLLAKWKDEATFH